MFSNNWQRKKRQLDTLVPVTTAISCCFYLSFCPTCTVTRWQNITVITEMLPLSIRQRFWLAYPICFCVGTSCFRWPGRGRQQLTLTHWGTSPSGITWLFILYILCILSELYQLFCFSRLLDQFKTVFPYKNKVGRLIMDTEKAHSIKHCHVDVANYADPMNCCCDGPEGGHKTWVHQQGLRTNQGASSAQTMMDHSLNKEASQLLCDAMRCRVEDGDAPAQNTGRTPVAGNWRLTGFGTRQCRPWLPRTIQALVWVSNWIYGSGPR
jgi:hypothetical protein